MSGGHCVGLTRYKKKHERYLSYAHLGAGCYKLSDFDMISEA